jgi:hypothetical protein
MKTYARLNKLNKVVSVCILDTQPFGFIECPQNTQVGFLYKDNQFINPNLTTQDLLSEIVNQAQNLLNTKALERGYDSILSLCTYATDPDSQLSKEGQDGVRWRSQTWSFLKQYQVEISNGSKPVPTSVKEVLDQLPVMEWSN